jgi:hypothetical protein
MSSVWLITGRSRGLGLELEQAVLAAGIRALGRRNQVIGLFVARYCPRCGRRWAATLRRTE